MANPAPNLKQSAQALIEEMRFRKAVEEGVAEADRGEFAEPDEVRAAFAQWGVKS